MRWPVFLPLLFPALAWGQAPAPGLLWKVSGHGLERPSFVVGTVHSRDARAYGQVPQLLAIIQGQDAVAGELDLTAGPATSRVMAEAILMPPGTELADLLPSAKLKRVRKAMDAELGPMALLAGRMKPFFVAAFLGEKSMGADSALVLDHYLQVKAKELGKSVVGVETVEEQIAAVDRIPLQEQADMLYQLVRKDVDGKDLDRLLQAYAAQDLGRLAELVAKGVPSGAMGRQLLLDRNGLMAARMDSLLQAGSTYLFAFGAAHLPGGQGVLELLRGQGYSVEAVGQAAERP
ncbi:MAG: TraB/GumN family protein [Flavobacteriales bacterium]|nr:TraB/GumN family protein [Flavobacteriales bacterium]MBP9078704.1 TraB/GumN family protein [Flavobacteriales bacterium]